MQGAALHLQPPGLLQRQIFSTVGVLFPAEQGASGHRSGIVFHFIECTLRHNLATMHPGRGAQVNDMVSSAHGVLIVLHHQQGIAPLLQIRQGMQQALIVLRVQADGRLIQHIEHTAQLRPQLGSQADALGLAAGKRGRRAVEREIPQSHALQETQARRNLRHHIAGNLSLAPGELPAFHHRQSSIGRQGADFGNIFAEQRHAQGKGIQTGAPAHRADDAFLLLGGGALHIAVIFEFHLQLAEFFIRLSPGFHLAHAAVAQAMRTPPARRVEREGGRLRLGKGLTAGGTGETRADKLFLLSFQQADKAISHFQRAGYRLHDSGVIRLLAIHRNAVALHTDFRQHHIHIVVRVAIQRRERLRSHQHTICPQVGVFLLLRPARQVSIMPLAVAHHRSGNHKAGRAGGYLLLHQFLNLGR